MTKKCLTGFLLAALVPAFGADPEKVLIQSPKPYTKLVQAIQQQGGKVTHQFRYVNAIAAEVPRSALAAIGSMVGAGNIGKDLEVPAPTSVDTELGRALVRTGDEQRLVYDSVSGLGAADVSVLAAKPNAYLINNNLLSVTPLLAGGINGSGIVVAVIDSGIRPGFPHITLDGSVVGCEDFVPDLLPCSHVDNGGHGTFVAGMISANAVFGFASGSFLNAVRAECPACFSNPPTNTQIPMVGTAPLSSIYAFRVFGPTGGAPTSRILAAMDRVIELRRLFDAGSGGAKIQVCNMSLGGAAVAPGLEIYDAMVNAMLDADIVPVISAGNTGPATLTTGSPGSTLGALTVGAASTAIHERILRRAQFGLVAGALYRPFLGTQTAYFSSRGPNSDGRTDPDVVANGFGSYGQGYGATNSITLGSGTSFSSPSVAGIAAILRQAVPTAKARQVRNAIIMTANSSLINDGSIALDRGAGMADAAAARTLLLAGNVPDTSPGTPQFNSSVKVNIEQNTPLVVLDDLVSQSVTNLKPGQRYDILYKVHPNTKQVIISLSGVTPALPPSQQNQLFGDDILLAIHSSKTSAIGASGDYSFFTFTLGGTFVVNNPEHGIMRVSVNGDWTNAGNISGHVTIFSTTDPVPGFTTQGTIAQSQSIVQLVSVPAGTQNAEFRLGWREDWARYPSNDVDLILVSPSGSVNQVGATLRNPELVSITNPAAGNWVAIIQGFEINTGSDKYELRIALDGKVVR